MRQRARNNAPVARKEKVVQNYDRAPRTIKPAGIRGWNFATLAAIFVLYAVILGLIFGPWGVFFAFVLTGITAGVLVLTGGIAVDIPDWYGASLFNHFTQRRRAVFGGFHEKLLWETIEEHQTYLKKEVSSTLAASPTTDDPGETMDIKVLITRRVDVSGTAEEAADHFLRYNAIEEHALTEILEAKVGNMFQAHFALKEMEDLSKVHDVQQAISTNNAQDLRDLATKYGLHMGIDLKASAPDKETKDLKRTPARAEALRKSIGKLTEDTGKPGRVEDEDKAFRAAMLLDDNTDYTEAHWAFDVNAKGLENMTHFSMIPPVLGGDKKGKGKK